MKLVSLALAAAALGVGASAAVAAPMCAVPGHLDEPRIEGPSAREAQRLLPIGGYTLSVIWLAQSCRRPGGSLDCQARAGKGGFVLHGLWPDGPGKDWPQWCESSAPLPAATLRAHYCTTPSPQLAQHEWTKHGTCMAGYDPDRYFAQSRRLFDQLRMPNLRALSYKRPTAIAVQRAFASANPGMRPDMLRLNVSRDGWLEEVWVCLSKNFAWKRCPATAGGAKPGAPIKIWRGRS